MHLIFVVMSENRANLVYGISNGSETVGIEVQTDKIFLREFWGFVACTITAQILCTCSVLPMF